jgi:nicotinate-nucleotide--dimethylbenzimidazole phosphoribosyltransferase
VDTPQPDPAEIGAVPAPDPAVAAAERSATRRRARALDLPADALGQLAEIAAWIAAAQGMSPPRPVSRARAVLLAGDHGLAAAGLYPWPPGATARRAAAIERGGSPLAVLARRAGVALRVVDVALAGPGGAAGAATGAAEAAAAGTEAPATAGEAAAANTEAANTETAGATASGPGTPSGPPAGDGYRVRAGSGRADREDALGLAEFDRAFATGRRLADEEADAGTDLLITGVLGVGADTAAAIIVAALRDLEPIDVVDRGDGSDDERWMLRTAAIRDALYRARPFAADPRSVLRIAGGADLAALAGLLVQAALRRTPVIIDGSAACAVAMAAERIAPGAKAWWLVAGSSPDPAAAQALRALGLPPLLDLRIHTDDGTGALAAAALVTAAVETAAELAAAAAEAADPAAQATVPDIT